MLLGVACRSKPAPVPPQTGPLTFDGDAPADDGAPASAESPNEPDPPAREGCRAGGVPWDGNHAGCLYEVSGCCYPDAAAACEAAGCDPGGCQILESAPAQITCRAV